MKQSILLKKKLLLKIFELLDLCNKKNLIIKKFASNFLKAIFSPLKFLFKKNKEMFFVKKIKRKITIFIIIKNSPYLITQKKQIFNNKKSSFFYAK